MQGQKQNFKLFINQFHDSFARQDFSDERIYAGFKTIKPILDVQEGIKLFSVFYNSELEDQAYGQLYMIAQNFYNALRTVLIEGENLHNEGSLRTTISSAVDQLKGYYEQYKEKLANTNYTLLSDPNLINSKITGIENSLSAIRGQIQKINESRPEALLAQLESHQSLLLKINKETTDFETRFKKVMPQMQALGKLSFYAESADKSRTVSYWWLACASLSIIVCGIITYLLYQHLLTYNFSFSKEDIALCKDCVLRNMTYKFIMLLGVRLVALSLCIFVATISIKNYRSVLHNQTANLQKANAFSALLALQENLSADNLKDLVNLGVYAIFKETVTGYEPDGKSQDDFAFKQLIEKLTLGEAK